MHEVPGEAECRFQILFYRGLLPKGIVVNARF